MISLPWFNMVSTKEFKVSITFSFKLRKQRKKCYDVSMNHHCQKLLDQAKILYFLDFRQYSIKMSYVSLVLWSRFLSFTSRELGV